MGVILCQQKRRSGQARIIMVRPTKEEGAAIRAAAASVGQSVQAYILQAIRERMEREQAQTGGGFGISAACPEEKHM